VSFEGGVELLGFRAAREIRPGEDLPVVVRRQTIGVPRETAPGEYRLEVALANAQGAPLRRSDGGGARP
jgi:hypothetical protein